MLHKLSFKVKDRWIPDSENEWGDKDPNPNPTIEILTGSWCRNAGKDCTRGIMTAREFRNLTGIIIYGGKIEAPVTSVMMNEPEYMKIMQAIGRSTSSPIQEMRESRATQRVLVRRKAK